MAKKQTTQLDGRKIYIFTGRLSQTVNICTPENHQGSYEWTVRLFPQEKFVRVSDVERFSSLDELRNALGSQGWVEVCPGQVEIEGEIVSVDQNGRYHHLRPTPEDARWIADAVRIVEFCIDELVREFVRFPYLHRVEHSVHMRLYELLHSQSHFGRHFLLKGGELTQPVHKEWPETTPRPEKGNRRGNFDVAILSPGQLARCTAKDFAAGRPQPPIAIEMGLNYKHVHLAGDAEKLLNSKIPHGYLIHLVRGEKVDSKVVQIIDSLKPENHIRVAFAHTLGNDKHLKLLHDPEIRKLTGDSI